MEIDAPAEAVWARVSDHEGTPTWVGGGLLRSVTLQEPGKPPGGLGATRAVRFVGWPVVMERIVRFEFGRAFDYQLFTGMPHVTDHLGEVSVEPLAQTRSRLRWHIRFEFNPWHPLSWSAPLFIAGFGWVVRRGCRELKRQIEAGEWPGGR